MARMRNRVHTGFWWEDLRERYFFEDLGLHGRIILKLILNKGDGGRDGVYLAYDGGGAGGECLCECGDEPSGSIKCGEFLD